MIKLRPLIILLACALTGIVSAKEARPAYVGAIIMDAADGRVLFEDNADVVTPPASMTKLMTFAVLHDLLARGALKLDTPVVVTAEDSKIGGTQVWLKQGETFPVEELIYAMMIQSGNDTAHALARAAAGSTGAFVELMNAKARELGMTHTTFRTPHGLPPANRRIADGDLTTPRDFAKLSRFLVHDTDVIKYTSVRRRNFGEGRRPADRVIDMVNHNRLLGKVAGVDGLKTGFTNGAGYCLSATAERNGRRVIVVVMGSPDSKTRDLKVIELLERGFAASPAMMPPVKTGGGAGGALRPDLNSSAVQSGSSAVAKAMADKKTPPTKTPPTESLPTIKTDKTPPPATAPAEQTSTPAEPMFKFRVIPPPK